MKLESSHKKIESIFDLLDGLDDLDKEAWMKLINEAEAKQEEKVRKQTKEAIERCDEIFDLVLPLTRLTRLILASQEVDPVMRVMIIRTLINEFITLLTPIEVAGIFGSVVFESFKNARVSMSAPIPIFISQLTRRDEDESRTVV